MTVQINPPNSGEDACLPCDSTVQSCPHVEEEPRITIRASLFFDGTGNNRMNTETGNREPWIARRLPEQLVGSYLNDFTNISKMERYFRPYPNVDYSRSFYIEGIGTVHGGTDPIADSALGMGMTGVKSRVNQALDRLVRWIQSLGGSRRIEYIHLDTFGFSRGAAAARYCIYAALNDRGRRKKLIRRLIDLGYSVDSVEVIFVGLFDTVASYGAIHSDDTRDLQLDAVRYARHVVHLAAAEEHRTNFPLTNIRSAGSNGLEIFLPGVHSDVGGGYRDNYTERDLCIYEIFSPPAEGRPNRLSQELNSFIDSGWYTRDELNLELDDSNSALTRNRIIANRRNISNKYARLPLHYMIRFASDRGLLVFSNRLDPVPDELQNVKSILDDYVFRCSDSHTSYPSHWYDNRSPLIRNLRHRYLHTSAYYGRILGAMDPHFTNDDSINGERMRIEYDG